MKVNAIFLVSILGATATAYAAEACILPTQSLTKDTTLTPDCVYTQSIKITKPLTLDCQGATLDGRGEKVIGILIDSQGQPLSGVTVKNCVIRNFKGSGIDITWLKWQDEKEAQYSTEELIQRSPRNVRIENVRVENINGDGVFVGDHTENVVLDRLEITGVAHVPVYFEHNSRQSTLSNSKIHDNGFKSNQPAVSIDASGNHRIIGNVFERNAKGGVMLYRNCQENAENNPHSVRRTQGANGNLIEGNTFRNLPEGVWVASRMSRDLRLMRCGQAAYFEQAQRKYYLDEARGNVIRNNIFENISRRGVVVEDNDNVVESNAFSNVGDAAIEIGTPYRSKVLGEPVKNVKTSNNTFEQTAVDIRYSGGSESSK